MALVTGDGPDWAGCLRHGRPVVHREVLPAGTLSRRDGATVTDTDTGARPEALLELRSPRGRMVLAAAVAGSAVTMITSTVVNVALPELATALDATTADVQWVVNAYSLALAALVLLGGALGDRLGRRRVFVLGTALFGFASLAAAVAPDLGWLLASRAVMGVGAALLTPGSLAILEASFVEADRSEAIGAWSGLGGVAAAVGPILGGVLLDAGGWRPLFLVNLPVAVAAVWLARTAVPESRDAGTDGHRLDVLGTVTGVVGLGGIAYALTALGADPGLDALLAGGLGIAALVAFVVVERRTHAPLVPPSLFEDRVFTTANLLTFVAYAAIGGVFLLVVVALRLLLGFSGVEAGAATLPITALMLVLSARSGRRAARVGARQHLVVGPLLLAVACVLLSRVGAGDTYFVDVLPGLVMFGLGLAAMVAPVTSTVLAAAPPSRAGVASGVNNAVARTAGLLSVAVLPVAAGLGPDAFSDPVTYAAGYPRAMLLAAGLAIVGAVTAAAGLPSGPIAPRRDDGDEGHGWGPHEHHSHGDVSCPSPSPRRART